MLSLNHLGPKYIFEDICFKSIETATGANGIGSEILDVDPFTNRELGQQDDVLNQIDTVTGGSKESTT